MILPLTRRFSVILLCEYTDPLTRQPLVKLERMLPEEAKHATVLVKLEMQNPGGSIKDRIALVSRNEPGASHANARCWSA